MDEDGSRGSAARHGLAAVGLAVFAVTCCAALPLLAVLAGSVAIGAVLGIGAGAVALGGLVALIVVRVRARRRCRTSPDPSATEERTPTTGWGGGNAQRSSRVSQ